MPCVKGRGGRPPKPLEKHEEDGTYRKDRHETRVDGKVPPSVLPCPADLGEHGAELWKRICSTLPKELITKLDSDALLSYCQTWELYRKIIPQVLADPMDKHLTCLWSKTIDKLDKLGRQFGWTPQARAGLHMPAKEETEDAMTEFLKRRTSQN